MHTAAVLQKCLRQTCQHMPALRRRVLLQAVEALVAGRPLDPDRSGGAWPGAERILAPLTALDRMLGNQHLHAERERLIPRHGAVVDPHLDAHHL